MSMNDRIAQMALEAGLVDYVTEHGQLITDYGTINEELRNFARLVAEDCAKVCDERITPERIAQLDAEGWSVAETNALATGVEGAAQAILARYSKE